MIPFTPPPSLPLFGELKLSSHGLMFLVGSLVCYFWTRRRAHESVRHYYEDALPWVTFGAIVGARLGYVVVNPELILDPLEVLAVWRGGLVSYGGLIGAMLAWLIYLRVHRLPVAMMSNPIGPPALVGWGVGRIGCLLSWYGEYGTRTDVPWAFVVDGVARHPVMLYQAVGLIVAGLIVAGLSSRTGLSAAGLALIAYGAVRFAADFFRYWYPPELHQYSQATSIALALFGLFLVFRWPHDPRPAEQQIGNIDDKVVTPPPGSPPEDELS